MEGVVGVEAVGARQELRTWSHLTAANGKQEVSDKCHSSSRPIKTELPKKGLK